MPHYLTDAELMPIRVPPLRTFSAEVVVLVTTLGVKRREYNASCRARDLLEIVRCHFKLIDFNLDTSQEQYHPSQLSNRVNQADLDIVRQLYATGRVRQDPTDGVIILPQIIIDGVNIGDGVDLQTLEDQDHLESILKRETCPRCLKDRSTASACKWCSVQYSELMPGRQTIEDTLATFADEEGFVNIIGLEQFR